MITEAILSPIFDLLILLTTNISTFTFTFDSSILESFFDILGIILFIFPPLLNFAPIFAFIILAYGVRIFVAIYHLIPFCG